MRPFAAALTFLGALWAAMPVEGAERTSADFIEVLSEAPRIPEAAITGRVQLLSMAPEWVFDQLLYWRVEFPLSVCFFGGSAELRGRIRDAARGWQVPGSGIKFDFGASPNLRDCSNAGAPSHIRIGFRGREYRSDVGREAETRPRGEPTMNFVRWDLIEVPDWELRQIVLHEFGHALGFHHEHQNPWSTCEDKFDWEAIPALVQEYGWGPGEIRRNLRSLHEPNVNASSFDEDSIMIYSLPPAFYKDLDPGCYHANNLDLSRKDRIAAVEFYSSSRSQVIGQRMAAIEELKAIVARSSLDRSVSASLIGNLGRQTQLMRRQIQ